MVLEIQSGDESGTETRCLYKERVETRGNDTSDSKCSQDGQVRFSSAAAAAAHKKTAEEDQQERYVALRETRIQKMDISIAIGRYRP